MPAKPNVAELVEQLPATDREIEVQKAAAKAAADPSQPKAKPEKVVGSKFDGPDPAAAGKLCEQMLAGGRESLIELISLIRDPAAEDFKNYKAEYLVRCLTVYVGRPDQAGQRRWFIDTLAAQAGNAQVPLYTRGFLVRELQWIGDGEAVPALGKLLHDEALCDDAARALISIGTGAGEQFRAALPQAKGRGRLVAIQSLGAIRDKSSAAALAKALQDDDREVRLAAAWGLARLGSSDSIEALLKLADASQGYERTKATQACLLLAENLAAAGKKDAAARIYAHLRDTRIDPKEQYIQDVAKKALVALGWV
jgi:HEAT repeat protein